MNLNSAAYIQRHRGTHPLPELGDRFLCPCRCGRILSREWFTQIAGCDPAQYQQPLGRFVDPSDDSVYSREQRGVR